MEPCLEQRNRLGGYDTLLSELRLEEEEEYKNSLKIVPDYFDELFELVKDDITKNIQMCEMQSYPYSLMYFLFHVHSFVVLFS